MFSARLGYWEGGAIPPQGLYIVSAEKRSNPGAGTARMFTTTRPDVATSWNNYITPNPGIIGQETVWNTILYATNKFVATTNFPASLPGKAMIITSPDGATWTDRSLLVPSGVYATYPYAVSTFVYDGTTFIGYGLYDATAPAYSNSNLTSTDGITWTATSNSTQTMRTVRKVIYQEGIYVAIGFNSSNISVLASSADGQNWTIRQTAVGAVNDQVFIDIMYGNGRFVVVTANSTSVPSSISYYSDDGITWTSMTVPQNNRWTVGAYGNGVYVMAKDSTTNSIAVSSDGITWNTYSLNAMFFGVVWTSMLFVNNTFFLLGYYNSTNTAYITRSTDGITWATTGVTISGAGQSQQLAYAPPP